MLFKVSADFGITRDADIHWALADQRGLGPIPTFVITQLTVFLAYSAISFALNIIKLAV